MEDDDEQLAAMLRGDWLTDVICGFVAFVCLLAGLLQSRVWLAGGAMLCAGAVAVDVFDVFAYRRELRAWRSGDADA